MRYQHDEGVHMTRLGADDGFRSVLPKVMRLGERLITGYVDGEEGC